MLYFQEADQIPALHQALNLSTALVITSMTLLEIDSEYARRLADGFHNAAECLRDIVLRSEKDTTLNNVIDEFSGRFWNRDIEKICDQIILTNWDKFTDQLLSEASAVVNPGGLQ